MNTCHSALELQAGEKKCLEYYTITQCFYVHTLFIDFEIVYEVIFEVFEAEGCQWVKKQIFSVFL